MILPRPSAARGHFDFGWLSTFHTFSFGEYEDPVHDHFRTLRVINEDWIQPSQGFGTHGHRDMEILTWVLEGSLEHKDSLGHGGIIRPGEAQRMTAGSGIRHSEFNASDRATVHLLQIWLFPQTSQLPPSYEQKAFPLQERRNRLRLVASADGREGSVLWHQDASLFVGNLDQGASLEMSLAGERHAWLQVARGSLAMNGVALQQGDGAAVSEEHHLRLEAGADTEVLIFELA